MWKHQTLNQQRLCLSEQINWEDRGSLNIIRTLQSNASSNCYDSVLLKTFLKCGPSSVQKCAILSFFKLFFKPLRVLSHCRNIDPFPLPLRLLLWEENYITVTSPKGSFSVVFCSNTSCPLRSGDRKCMIWAVLKSNLCIINWEWYKFHSNLFVINLNFFKYLF